MRTIERVDAIGGAIAAIETAFLQREIAQNAYKVQKEIETGQRIIVGVNSFRGPEELEITVQQQLPHPYDPERREEAEERQIAKLKKIKMERDNRHVASVLKRLRGEAREEQSNLFPTVLEAVKAYATIGEICGVFREVFGEHQEYGII